MKLHALALFCVISVASLAQSKSRGNITADQIRADNKHGAGSQLQSSDGTGASGHMATYGSDGTLTDGGPVPSGGGSGSVPLYISEGADIPPTTAQTIDDEFEGASLDPKWTWVNQGGATATVKQSWLKLVAPNISGDNVRAIVQSTPSTPYTVTAKISFLSSDGNYRLAGLVLRDSSSGKLETFDVQTRNGFVLDIVTWNSPTSSSGNPFNMGFDLGGVIYLQIRDDGTTRYYSVSRDGVNFLQVYSESRTTFLTANQIGLAAYSNNNGSYTFDTILGVEWFRQIP